MKNSNFEIISNERIATGTWKMVLGGDCSQIKGSGEFVQIVIPGKYLRRPISVCDRSEAQLTLVYKVVGEGTDYMSKVKEGDSLEILSGLGTGFDTDACGGKALLLGGGVGTAPLLLLAKELIAKGKAVSVVLGFNKADEIMLKDEFEAAGAQVIIATADGSVGVKGFVTDAVAQMAHDWDYWYSCGPRPMLKAVCAAIEGPGEVSMEERMGCGFGICYGCTIQTAKGPKRVCADGPVFKAEDMIW